MNQIAQMPRVTPTWLGIREPADAAARSGELVALVRRHATAGPRAVFHDLGCGTGSMGRWLAAQLPGGQHWIMHDRDPDLLELAASDMIDKTADGSPVTVETRPGDVTELTAADLDGATLVTASALLDLLTRDEVERIAAACAGAGCPALLTLSVVGRVDLTPADPLDARVAAAFNAHQRRTVGDRSLLGPDAVEAAVDAFARHGARTYVRPSPWRLGPDQVELVSAWFVGWLAAAVEQDPELAVAAAGYSHRRLMDIAERRLEVVVHHQDLLARHE